MSDIFTYKDYQEHKFQYQEDGELLLLEKKHACLYYEPGKGKTYPAIAALLQVTSDTDNVLILSTADSVRNMWNIDIVPQGILPKNTVIMSFTQAIQDATREKLLKIKWKAIIVDECHKVKSHNTQISKLVFKLTKSTEYVFGLTGTPRGNVDLDVFCQFHNLNISEWGQVTYTNFINTCCDTEEKYGPYGSFKKVLGINKRYLAGWERNLAMYTQRVTYEDGDGMPPLKIQEVFFPFEESEAYKKLSEGILEVDDNASTLTKLAAITKLHQAANGFIYYYDELGIRRTLALGENKKLDWLKDNVDDTVTIVYRHEADFEMICKCLTDWTEDINEFKAGKRRQLLLQCGRCESFNLQMCRHIIFFTMDYSFIKFKQMLHRVWRMGQENETLVQVLVFKNSVEEKIYNAVMGKKNMHDLFMSVKGDY